MTSSSSNIRFYTCILFFLSLFVIPSLSATELCHPKEKKVLLRFKNAVKNSTIFNRSWLPNTDCCGWYGVICNDSDNHVYSLTLMQGDVFSGPIPDAIGDLPYLVAIHFINISTLTGSIPFSITKLQKLETIEIVRSKLTGTIPGFLSKLKSLAYLDLSFNRLTGSIPSSLSESSKLLFINLSNNRLTGTIPESFVKLKHNNLYLDLSRNKLSGEVPPSFRDINFMYIDLSYNNLHGDVSMLFGPNKTTGYMGFTRNKLKFNMSKLKLHPLLSQLDISHNKIYGGLPKEMISLEWLSLNVSYNRLCGPIPQGGKLQTNFDYSSFFHNSCLCGAPLDVTCK